MENTFHENNELSLACALCNAHPDVHCESDDAFLCYACDARVHCANFLVARHARAVLCRSCKTPTQVHVSGPSVDSAVNSTCHECANSVVAVDDVEESVSGSDSDLDSESGLDLNSSPGEDEEGDIHVVPASMENTVTGWKRTRASSGLDDQEDTTCCSTSDPSCAESLSSDDDATSLSCDSNPRAHKRALFLNVVFSNAAAESSYS